MIRTDVAIVGAGLSGLYAAALLHRAGRSCVVLEARDRIGGRILSVPAGPSHGDARYDLGPAWLWPDMQPRMLSLVEELGLAAFPQDTEGGVVMERSRSGPPQRYARGFDTEPRSMRLIGGMQALVDAVARELPTETVRRGVQVTDIHHGASGPVRIDTVGDSEPLTVLADTVILALPPRLVAETIAFSPALPEGLRAELAAVPTWMAGHAKVVAIYDRPFWKEQGLSGTASSYVGPLMEIHDASAPDGRPALFGFVGLPAASRRAMGPEQLTQMTVAQLVRLFGPDAARPTAVFVADWAQDPHTATAADGQPPASHPEYGPPSGGIAAAGGRVILAGTEVAAEFGGYLEGALAAAVAAVARVRAG